MQLVMEGGSSEGDEDDRENEEVNAERVETKTSVRKKKQPWLTAAGKNNTEEVEKKSPGLTERMFFRVLIDFLQICVEV